MKITDQQVQCIYTRAYDEAFAANPRARHDVWMTAGIRAVAEWARKEALKEAANVAAVVVRARGTAREVADAVYDLRTEINGN